MGEGGGWGRGWREGSLEERQHGLPRLFLYAVAIAPIPPISTRLAPAAAEGGGRTRAEMRARWQQGGRPDLGSSHPGASSPPWKWKPKSHIQMFRFINSNVPLAPSGQWIALGLIGQAATPS